jgi:hypothetical protein
MRKLDDFAENSDYNNRIIQMTLREIDTEVLVPALLSMDEVRRDIIFRNMSKRAVSMIREEMHIADGTLPHNAGKMGIDRLEHLLNIFDRHMKEDPDRAGRAATGFPAVSFADDPAEFLLQFAYFISIHPPMALEGFLDRAPHPAIRRCMELMINGHTPESILDIIAQLRKTELRKVEREYDMIRATLESHAAGEHPRLLKDRLDVM